MISESSRSDKLTIEQLWTDFDFAPNEPQRTAILHGDGPLFLPAGPGSGKTRVLLWRVVHLVVFGGIPADEIFLSTFTEKAALQLREGLRTLLSAASNHTGQVYDTSKLYVGTVHALCQRLIADRRFYADRQRRQLPVLLDDLDQYLFLTKSRTWANLIAVSGIGEDALHDINQYFGQTSRSKHVAASNVISLFNRLSEECIDPAGLDLSTADPILSGLIKMYGAYKDALETQGLKQTDFALLQQAALSLLQSSTTSASAFRHVIIDEYQDTNTVQERIFFHLASGYGNLCVVGDDDQALYRFRGATVQNFVDFPTRCRTALGRSSRDLPLDINYRSRSHIVTFCSSFMEQCDWTKAPPENGHYRVVAKQIRPNREDGGSAVTCSAPNRPTAVCQEIAQMVRNIVDSGKVSDPNQIAFLFPSLKSPHVTRMIEALESHGFRVYAPRAHTFLETLEATQMLGVFLKILGRPPRGTLPGSDYRTFHDWLDTAQSDAEQLIGGDRRLELFVSDRIADIERARDDYAKLEHFVRQRGWDLTTVYDPAVMKRSIAFESGISEKARKTILHPLFEKLIASRIRDGSPYPLRYVIMRASSVDWSILDLFYRCCGFAPFIQMFDAAARPDDPDEGPIANLGLLSQYLSRFMERRAPIITGSLLQEGKFGRFFFGSYLYALYRRGESEAENADDPFPRGRLPFLTIHQSKGLEFPVVVIGNLRKDDSGPQRVEQIVRPFLSADRQGEPLDRIARFDIMRMFYVALSRAENLLILSHFTGPGQRINDEFRALFDKHLAAIGGLDPAQLPTPQSATDTPPLSYSYTTDFLAYRRCQRQYLVFRRLGFAPSRSQTMLFGSLVHKTLDDLHQYLIARRERT